MSKNEQELLECMRVLAAEGRREAPAHVEAALLTEFRKRARRQRLTAWLPAAGIGAIAATVLAVLLGMPPKAPRAAPAVAQTVQVSSMSPLSPQPEPAVRIRYAVVRSDSGSDFYALPEADTLPPLETAMVVRVQLPVASLRLMGFPINDELAAQSVQTPLDADVLLGQDGLARGVRLIQQ